MILTVGILPLVAVGHDVPLQVLQYLLIHVTTIIVGRTLLWLGGVIH